MKSIRNSPASTSAGAAVIVLAVISGSSLPKVCQPLRRTRSRKDAAGPQRLNWTVRRWRVSGPVTVLMIS